MALFWGPAGSVVEVGPWWVKIYELPELGWTRGAAVVGPYLYVAGDFGEEGIVMRVKRF